ncbi:MAG: URC4/urg3 family protein [Alphaproteobacteria bacterium]
MTRFGDTAAAVAWLRSPAAVRERCTAILAAAEADALAHFAFAPERLDDVAAFVADTIRAAYPTLEVPYHSRWCHFAAGGVDRWAMLAERLAGAPADEVARARIDLAVTSVLLDAGAGERWGYLEPGSGARFDRSEGLAVASFHLFAGGAFSAAPGAPLRADAGALARFDARALASAFQVSDDNPLVGLTGRVEVLRRLGVALSAAPELFGERAPRAGNLFDYLAGQARDGALAATRILDAVLRGLGPVWPGRIALDGVNLGDVWRHPAVRSNDATDRLVPFHKLSQWLAYSLVEPLEDAGIAVTDLDALTGLPEYRNGGLLIDLGVLRPKHLDVCGRRHRVGSEIIVEWRALTVALLDRVAERVRAALGLDAAAFPLAKVLEGGTWSAGRRVARERRADGAPPILFDSDGTVF